MDININNVKINIEEIRKPEIDAQLVAEGIASQLERRIMYRRAMKRAVQNSMRLGVLGIKVNIAGRSYPLTIERSEEEMIRKAADNINESVKNLKENYAVKDIQDLLAMTALQLSTKSNTISKEVDDDKVANELKALDKELSDFLEK